MYVMEYVTDGKGYLIRDGVKYTVQKGDFYLINRNVSLCYFPDNRDPFLKKWVNICGKFIDGLCYTYGFVEPVLVEHTDVEGEMDEIHSILSNYVFSETGESDTRLMQVFVAMFEKVRCSRQKIVLSEDKCEFEQITKYISQNIMYEKISRFQLCSYFFISERTLDRIFQKEAGVSPARFITEKKIEYAKKLLMLGNCSIERLAEILYFSSAAHFRRVFIEYCGVSPLKWKKSQKSGTK